MRRSVRVVVLLLLLALLGGTAPAFAQEPPPPPNPSDDQLGQSRQEVRDRAGEVGELTNRLAELDARTDDLQAELAGQRENAEAALVDLEAAQGAAAEAGERAEAARVATDAATVAIDQARSRLDDFVTATYQEGLDTGPLGLLTSSQTPEELVARAEFTDLLARAQLAAQDGLERARVDKANADSTARALLEEAQAREAEAARAKDSADAAYAAADAAARAQAEQLAAVQTERAQVQSRLDAAEASDAGLRDQRARYDDWQRVLAEQEASRQRAERDAASARDAAVGPAPRAGAGSAQRVIDRAMSQLGVQYVWGGGNGRGATTGIPGPAGDPGDRVGFDCSGLMLYAFNGAGVSLPRVSRNQFNAGRKVPISDLQPGDMVFFRKGGAPIHHVAMYIGDGRMIEAPYTGADVRIVPLRRKDLVPQATRVL
ncbi:C40 family peptidase [Pseudonocardia sp. KRD-184]|uniref:C40 family peptidase n=1 Tax=Pseudonocardia oceani TaxID=2792013 RepID=A0ABS6UJS4_9PSEU|nr:NlpC/P60 family protein [Pseudonocardia oceani]MBW0091896.1 C40 family peptidase [Pseudonocardia oceani]MBW0098996.1 C40 family peptidase [Pseudonocardia oceani]MBW0109656.1 C40 family peptidase [Pseudonocardia oceani]MBW0123532.1 C40 family peptidase [Pseudonocardia oceani]MBW0132133.1 C40 family peptidase [Pseudonocardia oceani]